MADFIRFVISDLRTNPLWYFAMFCLFGMVGAGAVELLRLFIRR